MCDLTVELLTCHHVKKQFLKPHPASVTGMFGDCPPLFAPLHIEAYRESPYRYQYIGKS